MSIKGKKSVSVSQLNIFSGWDGLFSLGGVCWDLVGSVVQNSYHNKGLILDF